MADRLAEEIVSALEGGDARTLERLIDMLEPENGNGLTVQRKAALADVLSELL